MAQELYNGMRFQAGIGNNFISNLRIGIITSYNPVNQTVAATIQPVDQEGDGQTGFIPLATSFIGLVGAPNIGDQVLILFQEGSINTGIVIGRLYSNSDPAPAPPAGEWWLTHPSGSFIKIKTNGEIDIKSVQKVNVLGTEIDMSNGGSVLALVTSAMTTLFNTHTHGGGSTPDQTMGSGQLTTILKAQ